MSPTSLLCRSFRLLASFLLAGILTLLVLNRLHVQMEDPFTTPVQKRPETPTTLAPKVFPKLPKYVKDCGRFPKTTWKWNNEKNQEQNSTALKFLKVFSSSFTSTYTCLRTTNISERIYRDETSQKTEVRTIFILELRSLQKMKRSLLSVQATSENAGVIKGVTAFRDKERTAKVIPRVEVQRQNEAGIINFDTSDFLAGVRKIQLPDGDKITVHFILWYESNSTAGNQWDYQGPFLNTSFHVPSLRLFYTL